jgi:hypothetical protein
MRVSYRWSSGLAVGAIVGALVLVPHVNAFVPLDDELNPCDEPLSAAVRGTVLICAVGMFAMVFQGFRGRTVPYWLAIVTLPAYALMFCYGHRWSCDSHADLVGSWLKFGAFSTICLHHIVQRPTKRQ